METMTADYQTDDETAADDRPAELSRDGPMELLAGQFERFYGTVYRYLLHRLFDRELAEELTAQTFYRAAEARHRLYGNAKQLQVWLLRTATNLANTRHRRMRVRRLLFKRFAESQPTQTNPGTADPAEDQRFARTRGVLQALPLKYQTVVVLRYYMEMSFDDIGAVVGTRPDAARVRLSRAIKEIRRRLNVQDVTTT